ncbi:MAG: diaminopimelate dehydrogenase [Deltaproteobacteria bacterium]|nr:diaminopimelate dehydrogenase [Deltaproteobacteria bacterium]
MTNKIKIAIVGWGNVGRGVEAAIKQINDMTISAVISRDTDRVKKEIDNRLPMFSTEKVNEVKADLAILCGGSATDLPYQGPFYANLFNTVDSFDTHSDIPKYFAAMNEVSQSKKHISIISAGWDPGTFSLERVLANSFIPQSKAYTFWGRGVSQGHSQAIRAIEGVADGIQYTVPAEQALATVRSGTNPELTTRQKHTRECFIALKPGADEKKIKELIVNMPKYFSDFDTTVTIESAEQVAERRKAMPHTGFVITSGKTGNNKALIEYRNQWDSNPDATACILVACARAAFRLRQEGRCGALTMLDIPPSYYSPLSHAELLRDWM